MNSSQKVLNCFMVSPICFDYPLNEIAAEISFTFRTAFSSHAFIPIINSPKLVWSIR
jgi:hypothetical protein